MRQRMQGGQLQARAGGSPAPPPPRAAPAPRRRPASPAARPPPGRWPAPGGAPCHAPQPWCPPPGVQLASCAALIDAHAFLPGLASADVAAARTRRPRRARQAVKCSHTSTVREHACAQAREAASGRPGGPRSTCALPRRAALLGTAGADSPLVTQRGLQGALARLVIQHAGERRLLGGARVCSLLRHHHELPHGR